MANLMVFCGNAFGRGVVTSRAGQFGAPTLGFADTGACGDSEDRPENEGRTDERSGEIPYTFRAESPTLRSTCSLSEAS